jgi:parallel beta-helix repeat protein
VKRFLFILALSASPLWATAYTVKAGGGGSFTTIQGCATAAVAGDTCTVFAGTYNETPLPAASGTVGNPITFLVNPGDCVTVTGFNVASLSYITIGTPGSGTCTVSGNTFKGFEITGGHVAFVKPFNVIIQNNYIHDTDDICIRGPGTNAAGAATFDYILNNIITKCGGATIAGGLGNVEGNHWLIDGNTFSHVEDGIYLYGANMVVRNNTFGPITAAEEGIQHPDAVESSAGASGDYALTHMLYEGNTTISWRGSNSHGFLLRDTNSVGQTKNVIRFSQFIALGSYWLANDTNSTSELIYNNSVSVTQADFSPKDLSDLTFNAADTGANVVNNIIANSWRPANNPFCMFLSNDSVTGFVENHNLCFLSGWSTTPWQSPNASYPNYSGTDVFNSDPKYMDTALNLHLLAGSPAIGAGGPLTTAVGAGVTSTALTVANASFFSDGYGLTGVQADWIRIGASTTVQISSINYGTNVITLGSAQSWSNNDSIYLYKKSDGVIVLNAANPNIGFDPGAAAGGGGGATPAAPSRLMILQAQNKERQYEKTTHSKRTFGTNGALSFSQSADYTSH